MQRAGWAVRTQSTATLACSRDSFEITASVEAFEGDAQSTARPGSESSRAT
jgi:hypothetical protein